MVHGDDEDRAAVGGGCLGFQQQGRQLAVLVVVQQGPGFQKVPPGGNVVHRRDPAVPQRYASAHTVRTSRAGGGGVVGRRRRN